VTTLRPGFDAGNARTWNAEERAVYETGHREGGSDVQADWTLALSEYCELPAGIEPDPHPVAEHIERLQAAGWALEDFLDAYLDHDREMDRELLLKLRLGLLTALRGGTHE